jgi:D-serine dehydratase
MLPPGIPYSIAQRKPFLWLNEGWRPAKEAVAASPLQFKDVLDAENRLNRFAGLLAHLFPELKTTGGIIESPLLSVGGLRMQMTGDMCSIGRWLIKGDHTLPVAGSIKARGGIYEVLAFAEGLALREGLMKPTDDARVLASARARTMFAQHQVAVGSTGNLGLSVGVTASALGFRAVVHMSADAKAWKKARLRVRGVEVIEHEGDFGSAVAAGRAQALQNPSTHFVDDENSKLLFLGYAVAALRLRHQLTTIGIIVDAKHPLFVYLPCGVGGAPGGVTFGLRHVFGDHVHCFFAEPVASPCMLVRLASTIDAPLSVRDVGLDNRTEADGLAVGQASELVARIVRPLVSGIFTVPDDDLFEDLYNLAQSERLRIEPSAAAGFRGPQWLESEAGRCYAVKHGISQYMESATHILWTTGGAFVPEGEYRAFHERGRLLHDVRSADATGPRA